MEDKKPDQINLKVKGQSPDLPEMFFKVKMEMQFEKLFESYCKRSGKPISSVRFMFDGERLSLKDTPLKYNMQNEDLIEVFVEQQGGFN